LLFTNGKPTIPDPPATTAEALFFNLQTSIETGLLAFAKVDLIVFTLIH
jgi:hypothetical protein